MEDEKEKFLRKLRQIEEHAGALTQELGPGEPQTRARLIWGLAAQLGARPERTLRQIEGCADALAKALPAGLPQSRARQIKSVAAHLALQAELESAGGHLLEAANDAARSESRAPA